MKIFITESDGILCPIQPRDCSFHPIQFPVSRNHCSESNLPHPGALHRFPQKHWKSYSRNLLELPAGARPGGRPEWVRDRRATGLVFGEHAWDLSWTHPCGSPQSNSSHLLRIVTCHVFFQWQTSSWAVLICGMSPSTLRGQPFHFSWRRRRTDMLNSDHPVFSLKAGLRPGPWKWNIVLSWPWFVFIVDEHRATFSVFFAPEIM